MHSLHATKRPLRILSFVMLLILVDVSAVRGSDLPETAYIKGLNGHPQKHSISCESRSAADLAAYWGISLGENEFLAALPRSDNPEQGFVGNPDEAWGNLPPHGYGVHAGPVAKTLKSFGLNARAYNHLGWDDLRMEISAGRPVIVWIIGGMWTGKAVEYKATDGSTSIVARYEHTMILVGYTRDSVQVVDAYSGLYQAYPLSSFRASWAVLGNMAVFSSLAPDEQPVTAEVEPSPTYTVQPGDYLTEVASRFGTTLQALIDLNSLRYPFTIYPGQVLLLPVKDLPAFEPNPVSPDLVENEVKHSTYLPLVQKDFGIQDNTADLNEPSIQTGITLVSSSAADTAAQNCPSPGVNSALLARIQKIILPVLGNNAAILFK